MGLSAGIEAQAKRERRPRAVRGGVLGGGRQGELELVEASHRSLVHELDAAEGQAPLAPHLLLQPTLQVVHDGDAVVPIVRVLAVERLQVAGGS